MVVVTGEKWAGNTVLNLRRWQKNSNWNWPTSWKKTSVDCLCSHLNRRTLMFASDEKTKKKKRSYNCSNVSERTHNLDPIWHPSRHMFLSQAFRSNVNKRPWALYVVNSWHKRIKTEWKKSCRIADLLCFCCVMNEMLASREGENVLCVIFYMVEDIFILSSLLVDWSSTYRRYHRKSNCNAQNYKLSFQCWNLK